MDRKFHRAAPPIRPDRKLFITLSFSDCDGAESFIGEQSSDASLDLLLITSAR